MSVEKISYTPFRSSQKGYPKMKNRALVGSRNRKPPKNPVKISLLVLLVTVVGGILLRHFVFDSVNPSALQAVELVPQAFSEEANQALQEVLPGTQQVPLILQRDERWGMKHYGSVEKQNTFAANGCAIASLAMIDAFWRNQAPEPDDILNWAGNRFYLADQGTSWQIFPQFAEHFGYQFLDLGNSFAEAYKMIQQGFPVIVSVKPGTFTTTGHLMVLALNKEGGIQVLDPNDSPEKSHYKQAFTNELLAAEGMNYWCFWL
jgi:hypothetical protein